MVNFEGLVAVPPAVVTVILPVVAPVGTVTVIFVLDELAISACVPLNVTLAKLEKFVPFMTTVVPTGPDVGEKLEIVGGGVDPVSTRVCPPELPTAAQLPALAHVTPLSSLDEVPRFGLEVTEMFESSQSSTRGT